MPPNNQPYQQPVNPGVQPGIAAVPPATAMGGGPTQQNTGKDKDNKPRPASTQNSLLLSELRDNMVVMADGSFRAVIACESINFDLMSSREREGIEFSYQNFLNSLYFPIQIFIRSQRVDIGPYLDKLSEIQRSQDNMLLSVLMDDYISFIDELSQEANIMDKSFYIVVPYYPTGDGDLVKQSKGFFSKVFAPQKANGVTKINKEVYEKAKDEIKNRVDAVMSSLMQVGVRSAQLKTQELGTLYYNVYNPDTAVREPLTNFNNVTSTYVRKGQGEAPQSIMPGQGGAA